MKTIVFDHALIVAIEEATFQENSVLVKCWKYLRDSESMLGQTVMIVTGGSKGHFSPTIQSTFEFHATNYAFALNIAN